MGPMVYAENEGEVFLGRSVTKTTHVSERTMQAVDEEVRRIIDEQYALARKLIEENQDKMHAMAHALLEWETIDKEQIDDIMEGRPPRAPRSTEAQENMKPRAPQPAAKRQSRLKSRLPLRMLRRPTSSLIRVLMEPDVRLKDETAIKAHRRTAGSPNNVRSEQPSAKPPRLPLCGCRAAFFSARKKE